MKIGELIDLARLHGFDVGLSVARDIEAVPSRCFPEYLKLYDLPYNELAYKTEVTDLEDGLEKACARANAWLLTEAV